MKICLPSSGFAPDSTSGGERYSREGVFGLAAAGDDVHALAATRDWMSSTMGLAIEPVWPRRGLRWPVAAPVFAWAVRRCVRTHRPDLVASHSLAYTGIGCALAKRLGWLCGVPLVLHVHHVEPVRGGAALERWALNQADRIVVDSPFVAEQLARLAIRPPVDVAWCGVPEPATPVFPLGLADGFPLVVTVGPVIARKRPLELVRLWPAVLHQRPDAMLVWIGEGPLERAAVTEATRLGISERVRFVGRQAESRKVALLRQARLFVFMSRLEGCPLAVLEAMACGLPVVAADGGPMPDILGSWAMPEAEMPAAIAGLLASACQRRAVGAFNRALWQTQHTPEAWLGRVRASYAEALDSRPPTGIQGGHGPISRASERRRVWES